MDGFFFKPEAGGLSSDSVITPADDMFEKS
jgi:hypothetical protein